jgi:hypothetical protein
MPTTTISIDNHCGNPLDCKKNMGGAAITAMNRDRRKGTNSGLAACIPATRMTKAASINNNRLADERLLIDGFKPLSPLI